MAYNYEYPYTDYERYNADWALGLVKDLERKVTEISEKVDKLEGDIDGFKTEINRQFEEFRSTITNDINCYFNTVNESIGKMQQDIVTFKAEVENRISQFENQIPDLVNTYLATNPTVAELKAWMEKSKKIETTWQNRILGYAGTIHVITASTWPTLSIPGTTIDVITFPFRTSVLTILDEIRKNPDDIYIVDCRYNVWGFTASQDDLDTVIGNISTLIPSRRNMTYYAIATGHYVPNADSFCYISQLTGYLSTFSAPLRWTGTVLGPVGGDIIAYGDNIIARIGCAELIDLVVPHYAPGVDIFQRGPWISKNLYATAVMGNEVREVAMNRNWEITAVNNIPTGSELHLVHGLVTF